MHSLYFILLILLKDVFCFLKPLKAFNYHTDITNPDLWVGHKKWKDCNGVIFTQDFHSVYIKHFKAAQVVLPNHGSIYITDGGYLEINPDLADTCIKIDKIPLHSYYNPMSWSTNNPSIPSIERIPCTYDEVMFPYGLNTPVYFDDKIDIKVKFIVMDETIIDEAYEFQNFLESGQWPVIAYAEPEVYFTKKQCEDESACLCHEWREQKQICRYIRMLNEDGGGKGGNVAAGCVNAVDPPIGECRLDSFCGGVIHIKPKADFKLNNLENLVIDEDSSIDDDGIMVYASKVEPNENSFLIQIVFAEDQYTGKSAKQAETIFKKLATKEMMEKLKIFDVKLYASGAPLVAGQTGVAVFGMIFGTFFAVIVVFILLYVFYVGPLKDYNFTTRLPSRSLTKTFAGVRYRSKDEEQLVYEGQSMAGSILSLDRAFDNPMYSGHQTSASTSTGETTIIQEQKLQENPMYNLPEKVEKIENIDSEM